MSQNIMKMTAEEDGILSFVYRQENGIKYKNCALRNGPYEIALRNCFTKCALRNCALSSEKTKSRNVNRNFVYRL